MAEIIRPEGLIGSAAIKARGLSEKLLQAAMKKNNLKDDRQVTLAMILDVAQEIDPLLKNEARLGIVIFPTEKETLSEHNAPDNLLDHLIKFKIQPKKKK